MMSKSKNGQDLVSFERLLLLIVELAECDLACLSMNMPITTKMIDNNERLWTFATVLIDLTESVRTRKSDKLLNVIAELMITTKVWFVLLLINSIIVELEYL